MSTCKKVNLNTDLSPFTRVNSKWIIDLNETDIHTSENVKHVENNRKM
jgi:hypothetical protein